MSDHALSFALPPTSTRTRAFGLLAVAWLLIGGCERGATQAPEDGIPEGELAPGELAAGSGSAMGFDGLGNRPGGAKVDPRVGKAENLIAAGEPAKALALMDEAIVGDADDSRFHFVRGNALSHLDRDDDALAAYRRAVELDERNYLAHAAIGAMLAQGKGELEAAIPHFQRALQIAPEYGQGHLGLGAILIELGRSAEAIEALENARRLLSGSPEVLFALAQARAQAGEHETANSLMRECIALVPGADGVDLRLAYARMLSAQGKFDAAEKELLATAELVPDNPALQVEVVRGLLAAERPQPALPMIEKLAKELPGEVSVVVNHGRVLAGLGRLDGRDGALARFDAAIALDRKIHGAYHYKAQALVGARRCAEAKKVLAAFTATDPAADKLAKTRAIVDGCRGK